MTLIGLGLIYASLLLLLVVLSALETAIHSVRDLDPVAAPVQGGEQPLERRLRKIRQNPFMQLQRTLVLSAGVNLALATLGLYLILGPLAAVGWDPWASGATLFGVTVFVGDVLPKLYAARRPSAVLRGGSRLLHPLRLVLDPMVKLADRLAERVLGWIVPEQIKAHVAMTRDEFETLIEIREEQRLLGREEASMIREVLDFEELVVSDAMLPRVDLPQISITDHASQVEDMLEAAEERFAVLHADTPDAVEGVIDVQTWKRDGRPPWREVLQQGDFIPETMPMLDALRERLPSSSSAALVVDEYGGLEGLISQEQIADWLLHEAAPWLGEDTEIREAGDNRYLIEGSTRLDEIAEDIGVNLESDQSEGIDTIGGLVFMLFGRIPKAGERIRVAQAEIKVRRVVRARVVEVELRRVLGGGKEEDS